jgi:hypothetical protein
LGWGAATRSRSPEAGVCFLIEGTEDGNANALLNGGPVNVTVEKIEAAAAGRGAE